MNNIQIIWLANRFLFRGFVAVIFCYAATEAAIKGDLPMFLVWESCTFVFGFLGALFELRYREVLMNLNQ